MTALDWTPSSADEPEDPAQTRLRPGAVRRLGKHATVRLTAHGSAPVTVFVAGDIDLACADELGAVLRTALDGYPQGIDLDLASVRFCDCLGLRTLLAVGACAGRLGRHFALGPHSPAIARLLELTGAQSVLAITD